MYKILIPEDIHESGKQYLLDRGYELKVGIPTDPETLEREIGDCDGLIVRNARYPKQVFEHADRLKVIARHGTGTDNIAVADAQEMDIYVVNGPLANINAVAEYTVAQVMALNCNLMTADRRTRTEDWTYRLRVNRKELRGSVLGVIGFGNIGRLVAEKATKGLGMKVLAYDIRESSNSLENVEITSDLSRILQESDFVTLHIPSTEKTRGMFDYQMFKQMKQGAYFVNCARGDLYVEEDLIRVLEEEHIAGAALDVYSSEPLTDSRLLKMEQVLLSQHMAGLSADSLEKMALYAAMGVHQVLSGQKPDWPVNCPKQRRC